MKIVIVFQKYKEKNRSKFKGFCDKKTANEQQKKKKVQIQIEMQLNNNCCC